MSAIKAFIISEIQKWCVLNKTDEIEKNKNAPRFRQKLNGGGFVYRNRAHIRKPINDTAGSLGFDHTPA
jgi:hypothetical protein